MYNPELEGYSREVTCICVSTNLQRCFNMSVSGTMHKVIYELQVRLTLFESIEKNYKLDRQKAT